MAKLKLEFFIDKITFEYILTGNASRPLKDFIPSIWWNFKFLNKSLYFLDTVKFDTK